MDESQVKQIIKKQVLMVAKAVEDKIDEEILALDRLDLDDLEALQEKRLQQMKKMKESTGIRPWTMNDEQAPGSGCGERLLSGGGGNVDFEGTGRQWLLEDQVIRRSEEGGIVDQVSFFSFSSISGERTWSIKGDAERRQSI